jgi:hypothetical protein
MFKQHYQPIKQKLKLLVMLLDVEWIIYAVTQDIKFARIINDFNKPIYFQNVIKMLAYYIYLKL